MEEKEQVIWSDGVEFQSHRIFKAQKNYLQKIFKPICNPLEVHKKQVGLKQYIIPAIAAGAFLVSGIYSAYKGNFKTAGICASGSLASCLFFPIGTFAHIKIDTSSDCESLKQEILKKVEKEPIYPLYPGCDQFTTEDIIRLYDDQSKSVFSNDEEYESLVEPAFYVQLMKRKINKITALFGDLNNQSAQMSLIHFFFSSLFSQKQLEEAQRKLKKMKEDLHDFDEKFIVDLRNYTMYLFDAWGREEVREIYNKRNQVGNKHQMKIKQKLNPQAFSFFVENIDGYELDGLIRKIYRRKKEKISTNKAIDIENGVEKFLAKIIHFQTDFKYNALYVLHNALKDGILTRKKNRRIKLTASKQMLQLFFDHAAVLFGKQVFDKQKDVSKTRFVHIPSMFCEQKQESIGSYYYKMKEKKNGNLKTHYHFIDSSNNCYKKYQKSDKLTVANYDKICFGGSVEKTWSFDDILSGLHTICSDEKIYGGVYKKCCNGKYVLSISEQHFKMLRYMNIAFFVNYYEPVNNEYYNEMKNTMRDYTKVRSNWFRYIKKRKESDCVFLPNEIMQRIKDYVFEEYVFKEDML